MTQLLLLAAEAAHDTDAVDERLLPIAFGLAGAVLVIGFITAWRVTDKGDPTHH